MPALRAILFDLDNTLLSNPIETFTRAYFSTLTGYLADLIPPQRLLAELLTATEVMNANDGRGPTNAEVFANAFYPAIGHARDELEPVFRRFYREEFPKLRPLTKQRPAARPLVQWAFDAGLKVVIATNPIFPRLPTEQRLEWAGLPVTEFDYALVTSYEDMHATKSHPAYYREILARIECRPNEALMVGDHWEWDVVCAGQAGLPAYWIAAPDVRPPTSESGGEDDGVRLIGQGTLDDLWEQVQSKGSIAV